MKSQPVLLKALNVVSGLLLAGSLAMVFLYAPLEAVMNHVQKIFYFHISTAWVGMLGFIVAAIAFSPFPSRHGPRRRWTPPCLRFSRCSAATFSACHSA